MPWDAPNPIFHLYLDWKKRTLKRFRDQASQGRIIQQQVLLKKILRNAKSDFGKQHGFDQIRTVADFQRQVPISDYEYFRPYIDRVKKGQVEALFGPGTRILMFTMTSGTTGDPKYLPVSKEFFQEYRNGWRLWGINLYNDHRELASCKALQLSSDWQQTRAESGVPCGNISGLAAETRPLAARRAFCFPSVLTKIHDSAAKHYATLRLALTMPNMGLLVTANPSTLIELSNRADAQRESLIRDIHNGTLSYDVPVPDAVRAALRSRLRKRPARARELEQMIEQRGKLHLRDAWPRLAVISVWTGGSVGVYLPRLREHFGETAIRDHGLSASEGRMTVPIADGTPTAMLDYTHQFFEFIPEREYDSENPTVLEAHELIEGENYYILLTTSGGLYRYDIHDIVRCTGFVGEVPMLEFLNKGKRFSSITGEKLSEHQVIAAVTSSFSELNMPVTTFTLAPVMGERPRYVLLLETGLQTERADELAKRVQKHLEEQNLEYAEKCGSGRLQSVAVLPIRAGTWLAMREKRTADRGNFEEYKHPCLVRDLQYAEQVRGEG